MNDQIHDLLTRLTEAWNAGDAAAYAALFTEDADYVTFLGRNTPGRQAIEHVHRALFEGPLKGSRLAPMTTAAKIRFIRPDVAVIVAEGGSGLDGSAGPDPDRASTITLVAVRDEDAWRFTSFQNTRRVPAPGGAS
ncbi:SgcJ/EcaC family oxidoreductase [Bailinhaonella thermotolerans]|uniref:SgcJ/EcaC family oxidoreductase n=1 Tax=Bailinhaonella thermotolerans TaxID=1070861 RepID=A0A3A4ATY8_9ACTN|nr:SgcJ/EcaC family oxidoreductase [Bailinhaonella thermotolerans]RJL23002.1 SgcJ/EcaC family oxidoreductase [Bailinhaonella thermotolerans]